MNSKINRNYFEVDKASLVAIGIFVLTVSNCAFVVGMIYSGFMFIQALGLIAGLLLIIIGLLKVHLSLDKTWARLITAIYLGIILIAGLKPGSFSHPYFKTFLDIHKFNDYDLLLNTVGFIPFGIFLMLSFKKRLYFSRIITVAGIGAALSFLLETSQYCFIPGRVSSMIDLVTNIIGTLVGISMFFVFKEATTSKNLYHEPATPPYYRRTSPPKILAGKRDGG